MSQAEVLPQLDASSLVDGERLEAEVKAMYRRVPRGEEAELHFEVGRGLAEHLGYPGQLLDAIPADALASFAGVGHHLDLAALQPSEAVLDLGSGSGTDVSARRCWWASRAASWGWTSPTSSSRRRRGSGSVRCSRRSSSSRPTSRSSPSTTRASTPSSRTASSTSRRPRIASSPRRRGSCGPPGRLAIADIVSGRALKERTRRNVELWAACIAGAIPRTNYLEALEAQGLQVKDVRKNDYRFISERARDACSTYEVQSISLVAAKRRA